MRNEAAAIHSAARITNRQGHAGSSSSPVRYKAFQLVCCAAGLIAAVGTHSAYGADTSVSGVVRDRSGVPQIDALVQLLRLNTSVVAVARTDEHGLFTMSHLLPGTYQLRATETSFLPSLGERVRVAPQERTIANITLSTLLDTADWLPAQRRPASEPGDDWKWTLRSSANRPLLRFADDGTTATPESPNRITTALRLNIESGARSFGQGGVLSTIEMQRDSAEGQRMLMRAATAAFEGGPSEFTAGFVQPLAPGRTLRTVASVLQQEAEGANPGAGRNLETMLLRTAESAQISPEWMVELGNEIEAVRLSSDIVAGQVASHPFASLAWAHEGATVSYRMATSRGAQDGDELADRESMVPAATLSHGKLAIEQGIHQELRLSHRGASTEITVAAFDDSIAHPVINGGGNPGTQDLMVGDLLLDPVAGVLRAQGPNYGGMGWMACASTQLKPAGMLLSADYAQGPAMSAAPGSAASVGQALRSMHARTAQAVTVAASGKVAATGTRWRTSYRWQPANTLTPVDAYDTSLRDAYLSLLLRQPMHLGKVFPGGMEALVDVRNLLAQGYYPFLTSDGSTLYFAQMDRSIQGGIAFTF